MTIHRFYRVTARALVLTVAGALLSTLVVPQLHGQELKAVPTPSLGSQSPETQELLREAAANVDRQRGEGAEKLGSAFGRLGARYLYAKELESALPALLNAVALQPEVMRWRYYLAVCQQRLGESDDALRSLRAVLKQREGNLPAVLRLADLLANRGEIKEAKHLYRAALQSPLGVPAGRAGLGRLALAGEDYSAAIEHLRSALEAQPSANALHRRLSHALAAAGRQDEAQRHLRKAGEIEARYPDPLMVQLALEMGDSSISVKTQESTKVEEEASGPNALRRAVHEKPGDGAARLELALELQRSGANEEALEQFHEVLRLQPENPQALLEAGSLEFAGGNSEQGLDLLERAVAVGPESLPARQRLAAALVASERLGHAVPHLEKAFEIEPKDENTFLQLTQTQLQIGEVAAAEKRVEEWLEERPGHHEGLVLRGRIAAAEGDRAVAEESFARVAGLDSATSAVRASAHFNLGLLRQEEQKIEPAVTSYRSALTFDPKHPQALFNLALILASNGDLDPAIDLYQQLYDLEPRNNSVRYRLAVSLMSRGDHWPALGHFEALSAANPARADLVVPQALLMAEVGQVEQAVARLEQAVNEVEDAAGKASVLRTLGSLHLARGDKAQAFDVLTRAIAVAPDDVETRLAYGRALGLENRFLEAADQFEAALQHRPDDEETHFAHAMALIFADQFSAAKAALTTVTSRLPSVALTHLLARILASAPESSVRDGDRAVQIAQRVFEAERNPPHGETLAMAMAAAERFDEATTLQRRLLEEARQAEFEPGFIDRVERNLSRYEQNLPGVSDW